MVLNNGFAELFGNDLEMLDGGCKICTAGAGLGYLATR